MDWNDYIQYGSPLESTQHNQLILARSDQTPVEEACQSGEDSANHLRSYQGMANSCGAGGNGNGQEEVSLDLIFNEPNRVDNTACNELPSGSVEALLGFDVGTGDGWSYNTDTGSLFPELDGQIRAVVWGD
ncbi:MAG: hypothetical protein Q9173_001647 [Seirophora scorigena]